MQYRKEEKLGREFSALGYGCLRFTKEGGQIDLLKAEEEIRLAIEAGVNYFDTGYTYAGSEEALGSILKKNGWREKVYVATKLPGYLVTREGAFERFFQEQLSRLQTSYVDVYLMHMLTDKKAWEKLEALGVRKWLDQKKESGQIKSVGFSFHGDTKTFLELLDVYDWDLCQIQYNYLDEHTQAGRAGLLAAYEKGIPVVIMEPLRGGRLVNALPPAAKKAIAEKKMSPAELGLRWLYDQKEVTVVLSGMNSKEMVAENVRVASEALPGCFTEEERKLSEVVKKSIWENLFVPCTGCAYCMPCPHGVDIPAAFSCYNGIGVDGKKRARFEYVRNVGLRRGNAFPTACVGCGACERHCPQFIPIREKLKEAKRALLPWPYRAATSLAKRFVLRKEEKD